MLYGHNFIEEPEPLRCVGSRMASSAIREKLLIIRETSETSSSQNVMIQSVCVCVCVCVCACVRACVRACVCVCVV